MRREPRHCARNAFKRQQSLRHVGLDVALGGQMMQSSALAAHLTSAVMQVTREARLAARSRETLLRFLFSMLLDALQMMLTAFSEGRSASYPGFRRLITSVAVLIGSLYLTHTTHHT